MFVQLNHLARDYCLIITASHAIFDGQSAYLAIADLFSIIEMVYNHKLRVDQFKMARPADSVDDVAAEHLRRLEGTSERACSFLKVNGFSWPDTFLVKDSSKDRCNFIPADELLDERGLELKGAFYSDSDQSEYISLKELTSLSSKSLTKMYFIHFKVTKKLSYSFSRQPVNN